MNTNKWVNTETILSYSQKFDLMQQYLQEKFTTPKSPNDCSSSSKTEHKNKPQQMQCAPTPMNFKAEIQRRYEASYTNRAYKFPREISLNSSSCDSSFDSIQHITIYELKTQNHIRRAHTKTPSQNDYKSIPEKQQYEDSRKRLTTEPNNNECFFAKNPLSTNILNRSELHAKQKFEELLKEKSPSKEQEPKKENIYTQANSKGQLVQTQPVKHIQVNVQNQNITQDYKKIEVSLHSQQSHQVLKPKCNVNQQRTKLIASTANNGTHCMSYQQSLHSNSKFQEKTINSQMMKQEISRHSKLPSDGEKVLLSEYLRAGNDEDQLDVSQNTQKLLKYSTMAEYVNLKEKARKISSNNSKNPSQNKTSSTNIQELLRNTQTDLLAKKQQNQNIANQNLYKKLKGNLLKTQLQNLNQLEEPSSTCFQDLTNTELLTSKPNNNNNNKSKINITNNNENAQSPSNSISFNCRNQLKCSNGTTGKNKEKQFVSPLNSVIPTAQNTSKNLGTRVTENRNQSKNQQSIQKTFEQLEQSKINIQQQSQVNKSTIQPKKISSAKICNNNNLKPSNSQKRSINLKQQQEKIFNMKQQQGKQSAHGSQLQNSTLNSHISPQKLQTSYQVKQQQSQQQQKCKKIYSIEKIKVNLKQEANRKTEVSHYQKHSLLNNYFQEKSLIQQPHDVLETQFQSNNLISPTQARQKQQQQSQNTSTINNIPTKKYQKGKTLSSYQNQFQDIKSLKIYQNINSLLKENNNMASSNMFKL